MTPRRRQFRARARPTRKHGEMNGLERAYALVLEARQRTGEIVDWKYEAVTLKLAHDCRFTPDFLVITAEGDIELHETKGRWMDDAKVKFKVAAQTFPYFKFIAVYRDKLRDGGNFRFEEAA